MEILVQIENLTSLYPKTFELLIQFFSVLSSVGLFIVAIFGLNSWKHSEKYKKKAAAFENLNVAVVRYSDALILARQKLAVISYRLSTNHQETFDQELSSNDKWLEIIQQGLVNVYVSSESDAVRELEKILEYRNTLKLACIALDYYNTNPKVDSTQSPNEERMLSSKTILFPSNQNFFNDEITLDILRCSTRFRQIARNAVK